MSATGVLMPAALHCRGTASLLAGYALHAAWQVPLLAGAAWCAVCIGRPAARAAHAVWVATLVLCVSLPLVSATAARAAAQRAEREAAVSVTYDAATYDLALPALQREPAWLRFLHRHLSVQHGAQPFALEMPGRYEGPVALVYLLLCCAAAARLLAAWRRMRSVVARSEHCSLLQVYEAARRVAGDQPLPEIRMCNEVAGPALAGVLRPVLLLPESAADLQPEELDAVLAHELAHLRRRDPLLHLLCSLLLVPVSFHPAASGMARRIRQTREMACDAAAACALQSRPAYAHALLRVADRVGHAQAGTLGFFGNGLFGAGLELFNGKGNLEERMQMLMTTQGAGSRGNRAARVGTCVSLSVVAVLAAAMVQVRPALAGEQAAPAQQVPVPAVNVNAPQESTAEDSSPKLLGGAHAREQLRHARRELAEAEHTASTDEDRRKIATARDVAAAAESALASADGSSRSLTPDLDRQLDVHVDLSGLKVDTKEFEERMRLQREAMEKWRAQMDSPEWKARMEAQHRAMQTLQAQLNSPEWKEKMRQRQEIFDKAAAQFNSPEFRARVEAASKIDPAKMAAIMADAQKAQEHALQQMRTSALQLDRATQLVARNEVPVLPFSNTPDKAPLKVASDVMAGNALQKTMPKYPPEAKEKKIQGEVLLHAIISEDGKVEQLSVVRSPDRLLSESALEAVQQWTYKPYLLNGNPVAVDTTITVHYSFGQ